MDPYNQMGGGLGPGLRENAKIVARVEYLFLGVAYISCVECLIRTDFNFAFALFCYYLWISSQNKQTANYLLIFTSVVTVVDVIWLFVMWGIWTKKLKHNSAWNNFSWLHYVVLFLAVVNIVAKLITMWYLR